jgi:DNA-binding NarL/FixJ family response regulator
MSVKVFIVDDHPLFRLGLRHSLAQEEDIEVVGEASDGFRALELVQAHRPDVFLVDIALPGLSGIGIIRILRKSRLPVRVVVLSTYHDENYIREAMEAGADGYVLKCVEVKELVRIIKTIAAGKTAVSPYLINLSLDCGRPEPEEDSHLLTFREKEILHGLTEGRGNKEIASSLNISTETVKSHVKSIYRKLDVNSRVQAIQAARQKNLIASCSR